MTLSIVVVKYLGNCQKFIIYLKYYNKGVWAIVKKGGGPTRLWYSNRDRDDNCM